MGWRSKKRVLQGEGGGVKVKQRAWSVSEILREGAAWNDPESLREGCDSRVTAQIQGKKKSEPVLGSVDPVFRACWAISCDRVGDAAVSKGRRGAVRPATVGHSCYPFTLELEAGSM